MVSDSAAAVTAADGVFGSDRPFSHRNRTLAKLPHFYPQRLLNFRPGYRCRWGSSSGFVGMLDDFQVVVTEVATRDFVQGRLVAGLLSANLRLLQCIASSVMTPSNQRSTTGPNIMVHKVSVSELPATKHSQPSLSYPHNKEDRETYQPEDGDNGADLCQPLIIRS